MGTSGVIGALKVVLGGDTSALDKSLKDSQSSLGSFGKQVALGLTALAGAATAATVAIGLHVKSAIDSADSLNKMSQSSGVATEELSKLKYAGELADVSAETLGKSMGKLSKALVSAGTDAAGQAGRAFAAMGVEVKNQDGTLRASSDVLKDLADKFSDYKDGAEKTSLAIALFGKAGAGMIPLLNAGRDGLEEAGKEAEKFGLVLDKKTTMAAEAFNDNLKKMDSIKQGLATTIAAKILPALEALSEKLLTSRQESALWSTVGDALAGVFNKLATAALALITTWERVFATAANLKTAFGQLTSGEFSAAWETMRKSAADTATALGALRDTAANLASANPSETWQTQALALKGLNREVVGYGEVWKQAAPIVGEGATTTKSALDKFLETQARSTAAHQAEAATIGKTVGEQERLKIAYQAQAIALANNIPLTDALNARIAAAGDAAALAAMKVAGAQATVQAMSPVQQFEFQMTQLNALYNAGVITLETYAARQQQIADQAQATWSQAGASIAGSFAQIAGAFGKESSAMATAAKVFGVIQGTISMYTGAAKALELPFPANIAAMAAVLAKGASLVASIKSQQVPTGFMTGGSFTVGGGGGPDSQFVPIMASPGEQVDIWRPGERGGDPRRGSGGPQPITVPMGVATTRDALREMIDGLNGMFADGYRLNVVPAS